MSNRRFWGAMFVCWSFGAFFHVASNSSELMYGVICALSGAFAGWSLLAWFAAYRDERRDLPAAILEELGDISVSGRDLRTRLKAKGFSISAVRFYQTMHEMEQKSLVRSFWATEVVNGEVCKEKRYLRGRVDAPAV